ncbi:glycosyltransferase [Fontibacillus sp. BL9]|uniref:glycosyltransferase n=1 Tax=Fontibacillus sp. BL9 TaxID=3389971 RepID=UPI00397AC848
MKRRLLIFTMICLLTGLVSPAIVGAAEVEKPSVKNTCISPAAFKLASEMRKLWIDHVVWTRNYIVSAVDGLQDQKAVLARLLKNQQDIGDAIKPYYGEAAGNTLAELLKEHILIAGKIVDAAKSGQQAEVEKLNKEWHRNADDIAKFLNSLNPYWTVKEFQTLLYHHLELITNALTARLNKDWNADIMAFDQGENHIIVLADALTRGIIRQFPDKFK